MLTDIWTIFQGSLREHAEQIDEYVIPHGDWFEIVSCPHYLAEIVISLSLSLSLSLLHKHKTILVTMLRLANDLNSCLQMMKVIYAGLLVASGGTDITIWLLFAFVVWLPFIE